MSEPTEVPAPEVVDAPAFKMSADGQALRAQLDAKAAATKPATAQPKTTATEPLLAKSADGEQVDLTTGEITKPDAEPGDYVVQPETALIPQEHHEEAQQIALDLEAIGQAHGFTADRMQTVMDAAGDIFLNAERELDLRTREQGLHAMTTRWGAKAETIISEAQRQTAFLGPEFARYMETSGLGNSIAAISLLAANFRGDLSLTPQQAQAKIAELRRGDDAMERHVIDRVAILRRVASPKSKAEARSYDSRSVSDRITSSYGAHMSPAEARKELDALHAKDSDLFSADGIKRAKAIKKRQALQAKLQGSQ